MSGKREREKVPNAVIRRLPRYYRRLDDLYLSGVERVSSNALAQSMGLTASQIRQDLSYFGGFGQQGYGYNVEKLRDEIAEILGMNLGRRAIVLGCGNLGRALLMNFPFSKYGVNVAAVFDARPDVIGREIKGLEVMDGAGEKMNQYLAENPVDIAVLTVTKSAAAELAGKLVAAGVKGIWNFTNIDLDIGDAPTVVENVHFADSLLTMNYLISKEE